MRDVDLFSETDFQIFQSALSDLYADFGRDTLAERTFRFTQQIICADSVSFDFFDDSGQIIDRCWRSSTIPVTPELIETYHRYAHQNPIYNDVVLNKRLDPVILSDYLPQSEFEQTEIYRNFYSIIEARYQMATALWLSPGFTATCIFCASHIDFTERDRAVFAMASPHLTNVIRNAFNIGHVGTALEVKNSGVAVVNRDGKATFISNYVRKLLATYFGVEYLAPSELPKILGDWIRMNSDTAQNHGSGNEALNIERDDSELHIRFVDNGPLEKVVLFEEKRKISGTKLENLGLTRREGEVLFWIAQGKSDADIGTIFGISKHTVSKHAQNIYIKLGVETRTAAMLTAMTVLSL